MKYRLTLSLALLLFANLTFADKLELFQVTVTNMTKGSVLTPQLAFTDDGSVHIYTPGEPASSSLEILAEGGDTDPLAADLMGMPDKVTKVLTNKVLLHPGETTTFEISGRRHDYLSVVAMVLPSNDTFVALSHMKLPQKEPISRLVMAFDAGTEENDQNCAHIPGPHCGGEGEGHSMGPNETDEGYVYIGNGFHDLGDMDDQGNKILKPMLYDWNNPVALVKIKRIKKD